MGVQYYVMLLGAILVVPLCYDLFKGRLAFREMLKSKSHRIELILLSAISFEIVWILIKIYLMLKQLPLSTKY